jgi:hypothetical protein
MESMFYSAIEFNADHSCWCVPRISKAPDGFSERSALQASQLPIWGTCYGGVCAAPVPASVSTSPLSAPVSSDSAMGVSTVVAASVAVVIVGTAIFTAFCGSLLRKRQALAQGGETEPLIQRSL